MKLTRRQRRGLDAIGRQLAREDPDLGAQLSLPAETRRSRFGGSPVGVRIGKILLVLGLIMISWGVLVSTPTATTIGITVLLLCWIPWRYGPTSRVGSNRPPPSNTCPRRGRRISHVPSRSS